MSKNLRASVHTSNLSTTLLSNSSRAVCSLLEPSLFAFLTFRRLGSSTLTLSSLLLALGYLQAYMHAVHFLLELSLLAPLLPFKHSGSRSLLLSSLSCWFSVTFKPATCTMFALFPSSSPSSIHVCCSSSIMLSMRNKTAQPHVSFTTHAHYVPSGQTGHTELSH